MNKFMDGRKRDFGGNKFRHESLIAVKFRPQRKTPFYSGSSVSFNRGTVFEYDLRNRCLGLFQRTAGNLNRVSDAGARSSLVQALAIQ